MTTCNDCPCVSHLSDADCDCPCHWEWQTDQPEEEVEYVEADGETRDEIMRAYFDAQKDET